MSQSINVAVIGAGWFAAQSHIPVLAGRADVVLDGVSRLGAQDLERVRRHFGFRFASEDYRELLERQPAAVVVASPHPLHYEHCLAALEAGAHVLCEKPMTLDPLQAWALEARARSRSQPDSGEWLPLPGGYGCAAPGSARRGGWPDRARVVQFRLGDPRRI